MVEIARLIFWATAVRVLKVNVYKKGGLLIVKIKFQLFCFSLCLYSGYTGNKLPVAHAG